jgi:hypothetical protein
MMFTQAHFTLNPCSNKHFRLKTMKKILSSLIAVTAIAGFASSASANVSNTVQNATVDFSGNAPAACDLTITPGTLVNVAAATLADTMVSGTPGAIETTCNTSAASLTVETAPTFHESTGLAVPTTAAVQAVTTKFSLVGTSGAYTAAGPGSVGTTVPVGLSSTTYTTTVNHANQMALSKLTVGAELKAPTGQVLAAGNYKVRVKATLTP